MSLAQLSVAAGLAWALAVAPVSAQSPEVSTLAGALDLYANASYDDALVALDHARQAQPSSDDLVTIERHRMLCLVALGRTAAAQDVVAGLLNARPDFTLTAGDTSPRVRAVFDAARARVLPELVRRRYADARRAYDAGNFAQAHDEFERVVALLNDPAASAHDAASGDLRVLAADFLQLSGAAIEKARAAKDLEIVQNAMRVVQTSNLPPPMAMMPASPAMYPATMPGSVSDVLAAAFEANSPAAAEVEARVPPMPVRVAAASGVPESPRFAPMSIFTYDWHDSEVAPPVALAQPVTGWWGSMGEPAAGTQLGAIEVVVDEHGAVTDARVYLSVNRIYDNVLLESVKQWRYRPAMKDGRPVKYRRVTGVVSGR